MAEAQNEATPLTLAEDGGGTLSLRGRALPYKPLAISGKQRAEFNWYPGNPQATVQMLGPEEQTITFRGFWKDKFLQGSNDALLTDTLGNAILARTGTSPTAEVIGSVVELVNIVDNMRRMGRRIKLTWDKLIRYGHIIGFTQTWHTTHYCEWELEFAVSSLEEPLVPASTPNLTNLADASNRAAQWVPGTEAAWQRPKPAVVSPLATIRRQVAAWDNQILSASNQFADGASQVAQAIQVGPNAARTLLTSCTSALAAATQAVGNVADVAMTEAFAIGSVFAAGTALVTGETNAQREDSLPFGMQLGTASYQNGIKRSYLQVRSSSAVLRWQMQQQLQDELKASFVAKQNMDLRDVSTQFYGTPDSWRDLLIYNGLTTSQLTAGQLIWVPQQSYAGGAGLTQGGGYY